MTDTGYSAAVRITLVVRGRAWRVHALGPERMRLFDAISLDDPTPAVLVTDVDDHPRPILVRLSPTDGREVEYERIREAL